MDMLLEREAISSTEQSRVVELPPTERPVDAHRHVLQPVLLPTSPKGLDLYVRKLTGELAYDEGVSTYGPAHLSFNTYFNSFYEDYWVKHTEVSEISLVLSGEGRFWCNIFREDKVQGTALVGRHFVELRPKTGSEVSLPVSLVTEGHGHGGRLFFDFEPTEPAQLTSAAWTTTEAPRQAVALGIGICTFNREPFVVRTATSLLDAPAEAAVAKVTIVNQGRRLGSDAYRALARRGGARLQVVEQANFGGAGGFTRSAMELMQDGAITHVLFMDDDIELDARHLATTAAFLAYARKPIVLGGHMLDLFRRNVLYEAGNSISPDNQLRPNHHNLDLYQLPSLTALSRATPSHFNGWWYAAIPVSCFRELGLPLPIFIRGDDLEYGTRLHRAGIETVALPPVSVWHEPFHAKAPGWQLYYDLRNRLIFASINDDMFSLDSPVRLLKLLMVHLIRYDYQYAWFMIAALRDFLRGPALLDEGLPQIHARVTREAAPFAPQRRNAALGIEAARDEHPRAPWRIRARMLSSLGRVLAGRPRRGGFGVLYNDVPLQWVKLAPSYVLANREQHFFLQFTYSRAMTRDVTRQALGLLRRYARERGGVAAEWKSAFPTLVSEQGWRARFGLDPAPTAADAARAAA